MNPYRIPWFCVIACTVAAGCTETTTVSVSPQQHLDQFRSRLQGLEKALGQTPPADEPEPFIDDISSRLDQLSGIAQELEYLAGGKADAADLARSIANQLNELGRATEGTPQVETLRRGVEKIKEQTEQLAIKL